MIIIEIQHNGDGTTAVLNEVIADRNTAEQTYHTKLSYAAVSSVYEHTVVMLDDVGVRVKGETYTHETQEA